MSARRGDVVVCLAVILVLSAVVSANEGGSGRVDPMAYLWAVGFGLLMLLRRSYPVLVLVSTAVGLQAYYVVGLPAIGVGVPLAAALFSAAETGHVRAAVATGVVWLGWSTVYRLAVGQDVGYVLGYELVSHAALMAAAVALGHNLRVSRALRRRTEQVTRLLSRQGQLDADARMREERLSLARELHDSIGHFLSVAALYVQVAREAGAGSGRHPEALDLVRSAVSDALVQLRRTVSLLRNPREPVALDVGLGDLDQLAVAPRAAGYQVEVEVPDVSVPADVGAAAFRVAQEAVTNAIRHSSGNRICINVLQRPDGVLELVVRDDGKVLGSPELRPGHGLSGMRERLRDLGGSLDVSAGPDGWRVLATIPTGGTP